MIHVKYERGRVGILPKKVRISVEKLFTEEINWIRTLILIEFWWMYRNQIIWFGKLFSAHWKETTIHNMLISLSCWQKSHIGRFRNIFLPGRRRFHRRTRFFWKSKEMRLGISPEKGMLWSSQPLFSFIRTRWGDVTHGEKRWGMNSDTGNYSETSHVVIFSMAGVLCKISNNTSCRLIMESWLPSKGDSLHGFDVNRPHSH
jgi:hypothetical protein